MTDQVIKPCTVSPLHYPAADVGLRVSRKQPTMAINTKESDPMNTKLSTSPAVPIGQPANKSSSINKQHLTAAVIGNAFEFYDFSSYSFFAAYIAVAFFPSDDPFVSLLAAVGAFGLGFLSRPLGGIILGRLADKKGRRPTMLVTMTLMAIGTLGLAFTPTFASIGYTAPILIVLFRLIQGFALGGEVGSVSAYLIEAAPPGKKGLYGSWQLASQGLAAAIAGVVGVLTTLLISEADMHSWGWRVPFIFGAALIPAAMWLRLRMPESLSEAEMNKSNAKKLRISEVMRGQGLNFFLVLLLTMGSTIPNYIGLNMTTFALSSLNLSGAVSMSATVVFGISTLLGSLVGGYLSDTRGRKPIIFIFRLLVILLAYWGFYWMVVAPSLVSVCIVTFIFGFIVSMSGAVAIVLSAEIFPVQVRAMLTALGYATAVAVFGGSTQPIIVSLVKYTDNPLSPAWYLILTGIISLCALLMVPETHKPAAKART